MNFIFGRVSESISLSVGNKCPEFILFVNFTSSGNYYKGKGKDFFFFICEVAALQVCQSLEAHSSEQWCKTVQCNLYSYIHIYAYIQVKAPELSILPCYDPHMLLVKA